MYGLADASLYWYNRVKDTMLKLGAAVFYWIDDSCNVMAILACHVDDFIWGSTKKFKDNHSLLDAVKSTKSIREKTLS